MSSKGGSTRGRCKRNKSKFNKERRSTNQDHSNGGEKSYFSNKTSKGGFGGRGRGGMKLPGLRKIQCYNCENLGHYTTDYWHDKGKQKRSVDLKHMSP